MAPYVSVAVLGRGVVKLQHFLCILDRQPGPSLSHWISFWQPKIKRPEEPRKGAGHWPALRNFGDAIAYNTI